MGRDLLPFSKPKNGGAVTPPWSTYLGVPLSSIVAPCSLRQPRKRGAPLRFAPFGVTYAVRGALPGAGRDEGIGAAAEPRDGPCPQSAAAATRPLWLRSNRTWRLSRLQASLSKRSPMVLRLARGPDCGLAGEAPPSAPCLLDRW